MGACLTSKKRRVHSAHQIEGNDKFRDRLSLTYVEPGDGSPYGDSHDSEDRSLTAQLKSLAGIFDVVKDGRRSKDGKTELGFGKAFSVGSMTDKDLHRVPSFYSKELRLEGDPIDCNAECIGYACRKGLKPEAPNQDSFLIVKVEGTYALYGVFDGHGRRGHDVSNFVKDTLPKVLFSNENILTRPEVALEVAFAETHRLLEIATGEKRVDAQRSGTTASVVLHDIVRDMLHVAHVGDSRCVLGRHKPQDTINGAGSPYIWVAHDLTLDHKPSNPEEKARIEARGGQVLFDGAHYRVYVSGKRYPGLNMSRAMGDLVGSYDAGISHMPDVAGMKIATSNPSDGIKKEGYEEVFQGVICGDGTARDQNPDEPDPVHKCQSFTSITSLGLDAERDRILMLCSDGIWEFISSQEAIEIAGSFPKDQAMQAAEELATTSWDRWIAHLDNTVVDDITALVIFLS